MSAALTFGWYIWMRHRRGLTILGGCWLAVIVLFRSLPVESFAFSVVDALSGLLFLASCLAFTWLIGIFSFNVDARLEARKSGFPARLWQLPLRTMALVGWPMLWGTAVLALASFSLAWGLQPLFQSWRWDPSLVWLALMPAVVLAWMQALVWSPFPLPWIRTILLILMLSSILFFPWLIEEYRISPEIWHGVLVALLPAAYGIAVGGVGRARRGEEMRWGWPAWLRWRRAATPTRRPFASAARAQVWFEWRRNGLVFPVLVFACMLLQLPALPLTARFLEDAVQVRFPLVSPWLLHELGGLWLQVANLLLLMPLLAWGCGLELGKLPGRDRRRGLSSYLATRPVSDGALVRAKFETAALSTLAGWGVLAIGLLLWFALGGHAAEMAGQFEAMRQRHAPTLFWGWLALFVGGAVGLTWLQIVKGLWMGLAGRAWVMAYGAVGFLSFIGLILFGEWLNQHPKYWPDFGRMLPWLAGVAVALKCLAAAWALRTLRRRELIPSSFLWGALAVWLALAAGLFATLYALLSDVWFSASAVLLGIVLLLPLTRLALAPLALAWNRHR
jgi:hypothetical protein